MLGGDADLGLSGDTADEGVTFGGVVTMDKWPRGAACVRCCGPAEILARVSGIDDDLCKMSFGSFSSVWLGADDDVGAPGAT